MGEQPKFSVIIPTHNRLQLLRRTVESVLNQKYRDYELIVIDDGSTDGSLNYLRAIAPKINALRQINRGPGAARNLGVQHAIGTYVAFLDSDDLWFPWTLEVYAKVVRDADQPAFMSGKPWRFRDDKPSNVPKEAPQWLQFRDYLQSGDQWRWWGASSFVVRRQTFIDAGGFSVDLRNGEDADLALRIGTALGFVQITAPHTFAYREHEGNIAGDLHHNVAALSHQIRSECSGEYPGGRSRRRQRWQILTRHIRPVAIACTKARMSSYAWSLYWSTFGWHIELRKWRFISSFPLLVLLGWVRRKS